MRFDVETFHKPENVSEVTILACRSTCWLSFLHALDEILAGSFCGANQLHGLLDLEDYPN